LTPSLDISHRIVYSCEAINKDPIHEWHVYQTTGTSILKQKRTIVRSCQPSGGPVGLKIGW